MMIVEIYSTQAFDRWLYLELASQDVTSERHMTSREKQLHADGGVWLHRETRSISKKPGATGRRKCKPCKGTRTEVVSRIATPLLG